MMMDPIADMLTRMRNAIRVRKEEVEITPISKLKVGILEIMKREGFIEDFEVVDGPRGGKIVVKLKYIPGRPPRPVITNLERVSKPSRRVYVGADEVPWVKNGLGIAILSTSQGLLTDREARRRRVGGEVLLYVF